MRRSKYAAIGDTVRVVAPKQFVRCGYPLSIRDVMDRDYQEIARDCIRVFAALEQRPEPTPQPEPESDWSIVLNVSESASMSATVRGMLCSAIAAYRLEKDNFGGNIRKIFEVEGVFEKGQILTVVAKGFVKTGKRYAGHFYRDSYSGAGDYEPGGLEDEKTHCVYTVKQYGRKYKILAQNCEVIERE